MSAELALLQQVKNSSFKGIKKSVSFPVGTKTFESLGKMFKDTSNAANALFGNISNATPLGTLTYYYGVPMQSVVINGFMYIVVRTADPASTGVQILTINLSTMEIINTNIVSSIATGSDKLTIAVNKANTEFTIVYTKSNIIGKIKATINQTTFIPTFEHTNTSQTYAPVVCFAGYLGSNLIIAFTDGTANTTNLCLNATTISTSLAETITSNINGYIINSELYLGNSKVTVSGATINKVSTTPPVVNCLCLGYSANDSFYYAKQSKTYFYNILDSTSTELSTGKFININSNSVYYVTPTYPSNGFIQNFNELNYIINTETNECVTEPFYVFKYNTTGMVGNGCVNLAFNTALGKVVQYSKYMYNNESTFRYSTARINPTYYETNAEYYYMTRINNGTVRYTYTSGGSPNATSQYIAFMGLTPISSKFNNLNTISGVNATFRPLNGIYSAIIYGGTTASASITIYADLEV